MGNTEFAATIKIHKRLQSLDILTILCTTLHQTELEKFSVQAWSMWGSRNKEVMNRERKDIHHTLQQAESLFTEMQQIFEGNSRTPNHGQRVNRLT